MVNNNIKILLVSFVHHIELQNFLNAPRNTESKNDKYIKAEMRNKSKNAQQLYHLALDNT